jgi:hypothetical protein
MKKILLALGVVAGLVLTGSALGQTAGSPSGTDAITTDPTTTTVTTTTADTGSTTEITGSFETLSSGNKDIASALYDANLDAQLTTQDGANLTEFTLDDIAAMKGGGMGWGQIFEQMQAEGYIGSDVKNLGQLISGYKHQQHGVTTGTDMVITNGAGGQVVVGNSNSSKNKGSAMAGVKSGSGNGLGQGGKGLKAKGFGPDHGGSITTGHGSSVAGVTAASGHGIGNGSGMGKATGHGKVK